MPLSRYLYDEARWTLIDVSGARPLFTFASYFLTGFVLVGIGGAIYMYSNTNTPPYRERL
jgi:hypothetical protein